MNRIWARASLIGMVDTSYLLPDRSGAAGAPPDPAKGSA
jgi:hypothetical protein